MFKKFFIAAILAAFMLSAQIAAAYSVDWSKVQRISSKSDLAVYIERERRNGQTVIPVILVNGLTISDNEFINLCPSSVVSGNVVANDGQNIWIVYTLLDYPGTKVANAYLSGQTAWLTDEEKRLYNVAVKIVNEAKKKYGDDILNKEIYIYWEIMNRSTYLDGDKNNQPRFCTATGVLLDGKANCQGYSDAFYMLGRMCGLNVGRIGGRAGGVGHQWNTITFPDGKTYFMDATWDDSLIRHNGVNYNACMYFNAPVEIMEATHSWDRSLEPANLQPSVYNRYGYCCLGSNLARASSAEVGLKLLIKNLKENNEWFSVMVPYDKKYIDQKNRKAVANYIARQVGKDISLNTWPFGKYLFLTARVL